MFVWPESTIPLTTLLLLNVLSAVVLTAAFLKLSPLRRSAWARGVTLLYISASVAILLHALYDMRAAVAEGERAPAVAILLTMLLYLPLFTFILSRSVQMSIELYLFRVCRADRRDLTMERFRRHFARAFRSREEQLLERKLAELATSPANPQLHRDLMELYLDRDQVAHALYHAYSLVELLPAGHAHQLALYRLAQILADRLNHLDWAQPHLRRIIRLYPRTFAASYARRLVNQYEAYADHEA